MLGYGRSVDFELPAEDDPRRHEVRAWLSDHPNPSARQLAEGGYVVPHWPPPYGLGADPVSQLVIDDELSGPGSDARSNPIGNGWAGPTILFAGTAEQQERYLLPMLAGEEFWCQLFSEPGAGSTWPAWHAGRPRRGGVGRQRAEDLDERRAVRAVRHPHRPHRP